MHLLIKFYGFYYYTLADFRYNRGSSSITSQYPQKLKFVDNPNLIMFGNEELKLPHDLLNISSEQYGFTPISKGVL